MSGIKNYSSLNMGFSGVTNVVHGSIQQCNRATKDLVRQARSKGEPVSVVVTHFTKGSKAGSPNWKETFVATNELASVAKAYNILRRQFIIQSHAQTKINKTKKNKNSLTAFQKMEALGKMLIENITKTIDASV